MSESAKKKNTPRKRAVPAAKAPASRATTTDQKQSDSDDVERAVYDGMQDLRVKKSG